MSMVRLDFSKVFDELFHDILLEEVEDTILRLKHHERSLLKSPCREETVSHVSYVS